MGDVVGFGGAAERVARGRVVRRRNDSQVRAARRRVILLQASTTSLSRSPLLQPVSARRTCFRYLVEKEAAQRESNDENEKSAAKQDKILKMVADGRRGR